LSSTRYNVLCYSGLMHKYITRISLLIFVTLATGVLGNTAAFAAKPVPITPVSLGNDISYPQCNSTLIKGQAFGIVGVNGGMANNTNSCLATQISWALKSVGGTGQDKVALYVNTANPGLLGSWWPSSNIYGNSTVTNPYGSCDGSDSVACAYIYGYAKAYDDATIRGVKNPASYLWWLDVETGNSWETNTAANAADLEGMTAYFQSIGARVGIYSTTYQWGQIVGTTASSSNLYNLKNWIPGSTSQTSAKLACSSAPLTLGSTITLTQFVSKNIDYDYSCI